MSETLQNAAGTAQAVNGQAAPTGDTTDYRALYEREAARARGLQPFVEAAGKYGFKNPDDFTGYGKFNEAIRSRGLDLNTATRLFSAQPEPQAGGGDDDVRRELAELKEWRKQQEEWRQSQEQEALNAAFSAHDKEEQAELAALHGQLKGLFKEGDPDADLYLSKAELDWRKSRENAYFEDGHKLRDYRTKLAGEEGLKKIVGTVQERLKSRKGGILANLGAKAAGSATSTPAGNNSGKGSASAEELKTSRTRDDQIEDSVKNAMSQVAPE